MSASNSMKNAYSHKLRSLFISLTVFGITTSVSAGIIFAIQDNGNGTSDWTISGSGLTSTESSLGFFTFAPNDVLTTFDIPSTSGSWSIGGISTTLEQIDNETDLVDSIVLSFGSSIPAGTDLSTATGTVTFNYDAGALSLPLVSSQGYGAFTGQSASIQNIPEPVTALLLGIGGIGSWLLRRFKAA